MKFTLKWLKEYLITSASVEEIVGALNSIGLEVENVENKGALYENFCIAYIESISAHPNADSLRVCSVNDGSRVWQVVCGASNARAGLKVVLAKVGAIVPESKLCIKKTMIRSVESEGMLCSAGELMLPSDIDVDGIMELPSDVEIGRKFSEYAGLDDVVLEIAITPNRGDCASVYGVARDLSAAGVGVLKTLPNYDEVHCDAPTIGMVSNFGIYLEDVENVSEFCARYISDIKNNGKLNNKLLQAVGYNSKNKLVDISNYMMFSLGRPNHIYDADKIEGDVRVRQSLDGERFVAIGGQEYVLPCGLTVISDDVKILGVAGVIGGELSKVDEGTKNILIEVASFKRSAIIRSGRELGIVTDARFRFERGVDLGSTKFFMDFITDLIVSECGGKVCESCLCEGVQEDFVKLIHFDYEKIIKITDLAISKELCLEILFKLGFAQDRGDIKVPSWRYGNISILEDLAEEILRIYGVDNIAERQVDQISNEEFYNLLSNQLVDKRQVCRDAFLARGLSEVITWSFVSERFCRFFGFKDLVLLQNPISVDFAAMRPTILIGLMMALQKNIARGFEDLGLFEIGKVYSESEKGYSESLSVAAIRVGLFESSSLHCNVRESDFYDIKDDAILLLGLCKINVSNLSFDREVPSYYHPRKAARICMGNKMLGYCGELNPRVVKLFDLKIPVMALELCYDSIPDLKNKYAMRPLSEYQHVKRDFAFLIDKSVAAAHVMKAIDELRNPLIIHREIFDMYEGDAIPGGKKSIGVNVILQSNEKTLVDKEIDLISMQIIENMKKRVGAVIR